MYLDGKQGAWFQRPRALHNGASSNAIDFPRFAICRDNLVTATPQNPTFGMKLLQIAFRSRRRIATALAIVCAIFLGYHVIFGQNGLTVYQQKRKDYKVLNQQIQQLQQENSRLKAHTERLQGDSDAIEHEAREKLHYTRPGEVIYTLDDPPRSDAKNPPHTAAN